MASQAIEKERIFGLDFVRALVALFVVFHHLMPISPLAAPCPSLAMLGSLGVELLFVLCGFLLGQSLLKVIGQKKFSTGRELFQFLCKRWLRILPAYYFFFFVSAALFPPFFSQVLGNWQYLIFMQNFAWKMPSFYFQAWTLSILEFFYVLFAVGIFFCWKFSGRKLLSFAICLSLFFFIPLLLRAIYVPLQNTDDFEATVRRWVIYRLDAPVFGVLMAVLMKELPQVWNWIYARSWIALTLFAGVVVYHLVGFPLLYTNHWFEVLFYPAVCASFALTLPALMTWKENRSLFGRAISFISQRSYSIYVSHVAAIVLILNILVQTAGLDLSKSYIVYPVCYGFIILVSCFSYSFIELPFVSKSPAQPFWVRAKIAIQASFSRAYGFSRRSVMRVASSLDLF